MDNEIAQMKGMTARRVANNGGSINECLVYSVAAAKTFS